MKEPFFEVKKLLPELCSADLELVIFDATSLLRKACVREAAKVMQFTTDPDVIKRLRNL